VAGTPTENDRSLLTVIARMTAKPGKEAELRAGLEALIPTTLAEDGNVNYDLHVAADDPATFFFYENWTSRDKLDTHLAAPHLTDFATKLDDLLVGGADGLVITPVKRIA
jgi:quinol monooxygenase YgiN